MNELKHEDVMREEDSHCKMMKKALELLCEKNATIANYIRQIAEMQAQIATQDRELTALMQHKKIEANKDAEIERLQGALKAEERHNELTMECAKKALANARTEAITEFEERLKGRFNLYKDAMYSETTVHDVITHIANEMKGETPNDTVPKIKD